MFIGEHDRLKRHLDPGIAGPAEHRLVRLLDGHSVLGYTTDEQGTKWFVKAVRAKLRAHVHVAHKATDADSRNRARMERAHRQKFGVAARSWVSSGWLRLRRGSDYRTALRWWSRGYLPAGDESYVSRRRRSDLVTAHVAFGSLALCGLIPGLPRPLVVIWEILLTGALLTAVFLWTVGADRGGVELAIDERGIYFGDLPRSGLVPWQQVSTVVVGEEHREERGGSVPFLWVHHAAPADLSATDTGRARRAGCTKLDRDAAARALSRYAPPHVRVRGVTADDRLPPLSRRDQIQ